MTLSRQEEMEERRQVVENERRVRKQGSTFAQFAQSDANERRGRFDAHEKSTVIGATSVPKYPAGPAWCDADQGLEPPLGYRIDAQEPLEPSLHSPAQGNSGDPDAPSTTAAMGLVSSAGRRPSSRAYRRA
jgi:hypothetical protein